MDYKDLGKILLEKLTKEELAALCDAYDDGSIETMFMDILLPKDMENRPEEYSKSNDEIADAAEERERKL